MLSVQCRAFSMQCAMLSVMCNVLWLLCAMASFRVVVAKKRQPARRKGDTCILSTFRLSPVWCAYTQTLHTRQILLPTMAGRETFRSLYGNL